MYLRPESEGGENCPLGHPYQRTWRRYYLFQVLIVSVWLPKKEEQDLVEFKL